MFNEQLLSEEQAKNTLLHLRKLREDYKDIKPFLQATFAISNIVGVYPAIHGQPKQQEELNLLIERLSRRSDKQAADPLLILLIVRNLKESGLCVSAVEPLLKAMQQELLKQPREALKLGRLRYIGYLLNELGHDLHKQKNTRKERRMLASSGEWLTLPEEELGNLIDIMFAEKIALTKSESDILSLIAIAELRNYKVDLGSKILRLVYSNGQPTDLALDAVQFIAIQRRRDGLYGFLNPFKEKNMDRENSDKNFYLPMTLNVLWLMNCIKSHPAKGEEAAHARYA